MSKHTSCGASPEVLTEGTQQLRRQQANLLVSTWSPSAENTLIEELMTVMVARSRVLQAMPMPDLSQFMLDQAASTEHVMEFETHDFHLARYFDDLNHDWRARPRIRYQHLEQGYLGMFVDVEALPVLTQSDIRLLLAICHALI